MRTRMLLPVLAVVLAVGAPVAGQERQDPPPPPPPPPTDPWQLVPEMSIKLAVLNRLHSGSTKEGDRVNYRVEEDVVDPGGNVLIRKGALAYGSVARSRRPGMFGRRGRLEITVDYTTSVDGQRVSLRAVEEKGGRSSAGATIAATVLVAPIAMLFTGSHAVIEPETALTAWVDTTLTVDGDASTATPPPTGPPQVFVLKNGDRITGRLVSLADGVYTVATDQGTLRIEADDVERIIAPDSAAR